jgi:hypothetical protein
MARRKLGAPNEQLADSTDEEQRRRVLAKAVLRAAISLDLSQAALAEILGASESSISRMKEDGYRLGPKEFELAALLVRVYRSIDALMGGNQRNLRAWFHAENDHLQGAPVDLVLRVEGLTRVAQYLDFMRGAQ